MPRAVMDLDLGVKDDDYDPRKPEYIRPATAEESAKLHACIVRKQVETLESVTRKRRGDDPTVASHYDRVANELRVSAGFRPRATPRRVRTEPVDDWAHQVVDQEESATKMTSRRIRSLPSYGWAHQPIGQQNADAGKPIEDAKVAPRFSLVQVGFVEEVQFPRAASRKDFQVAYTSPFYNGNRFPAQPHPPNSGAQTQYSIQQGRWVKRHGPIRMAAFTPSTTPNQASGGASSMTFAATTPVLQYRNHLGHGQRRMLAVSQQAA